MFLDVYQSCLASFDGGSTRSSISTISSSTANTNSGSQNQAHICSTNQLLRVHSSVMVSMNGYTYSVNMTNALPYFWDN